MKLKHIRLQRLFIRFIHFIQLHLKKIIILSIFFTTSLLIFKANQFLNYHQIKPQRLMDFFQSPIENLDHTNQRTNFLLLGIKGEGTPDVPDLADTILIASYSHPDKQITTISIPRDLWIDSLKTKINAVYHYGQQRQPPSGIQLTQAAILEVLDLPIHYTAIIDFNGFIQVIDLLKGIKINVANEFTDTQFPIPGKENAYPVSDRYQTIHFDAGPQVMDGETALKFVRSRHSDGDEGTDFARSKRQQLLLQSLRQQLLSTNTLFNKNLRDNLYQIALQNTISNIDPSLYPALIRLILDSRQNPVSSINLSSEPDEEGVSILENPPRYLYQNQWVLIPKDNNPEALKQYLKNKL